MLQLAAVRAQHVEPIIEVFRKLLDVGAPREFLQTPDAAELDGVCTATVLVMHQPPHLHAVPLFSTCEGNAPAIHVLGVPIHEERLKHRGEVPSIDAVNVVLQQPLLANGLLHIRNELHRVPPLLGWTAEMVQHPVAPDLEVRHILSPGEKQRVLLSLDLEDARLAACPR